MSVTLAYKAQSTVTETLATNIAGVAANKRVVTHDSWNFTHDLTSGTTPPVTDIAEFQKAMVAGAATIDLTAMTGTNGSTVNATGLKVQVAKFRNPSTNANPITIAEGAANGYALGGALFTWIIQPGQEITVYGNDASPDVGATDKNIDISGTGTQALDCQFVVG